MAKNKGIYFLGRVHKGGELDDETIIQSILSPTTIQARNNAWSFIESVEFEDFVFAKLVKFQPKGEVYVINEDENTEEKQPEPNLRVAVSPFIYIPAYSGICFLRVSGHIYENNFDKRFSKIIKDTNNDFFVDCEIEMVTDLKTFAKRLVKLQSIDRIFAKVNPPNPLYGPLWKKLKEYLERRNTNDLKIDENSEENSSLNTNLREHIEGVLSQTKEEPYLPDEVDLTDSAILMAADGYGNGKVEGIDEDKQVVIRTAETIKNFKFQRDPEPEELYNFAVSEFIKINDERHLHH
jgi:hypothetical protein